MAYSDHKVLDYLNTIYAFKECVEAHRRGGIRSEDDFVAQMMPRRLATVYRSIPVELLQQLRTVTPAFQSDLEYLAEQGIDVANPE